MLPMSALSQKRKEYPHPSTLTLESSNFFSTVNLCSSCDFLIKALAMTGDQREMGLFF